MLRSLARLAALRAPPGRSLAYLTRPIRISTQSSPFAVARRLQHTEEGRMRPLSFGLGVAKWFLLGTGAAVWTGLALNHFYDWTASLEDFADEVTQFYDLQDSDAETLSAKEEGLQFVLDLLRRDAKVQAHLGGDFLIWKNVALPSNTVPAGFDVPPTPTDVSAWYPSLILMSPNACCAVNMAFYKRDEAWVPVAVRVYPYAVSPDIVDVQGNLPHGLLYYSRLA